MKDKMMNDKHETVTQARKALDSVTENIIGVESVYIDKNYYREDGTARLTITVEYRTDIEQVIPTPKRY